VSPDPALPEPTCAQAPDGTYVFEVQAADGARLVAVVLPEDVDEIAGPAGAAPADPEERRRRFQVARLLAEQDFQAQIGAR
jgi:hypothetical protein